MHDSLLRRIHVKQPHPEFFTVGLERRNLLGGNEIGNWSAARLGRNIVVNRGHGPRRLAHFSPRDSQAIEGLRRSHLMHQVQIDINDRRPAVRLRYQMRIPDLLEKRSLGGHPNFPEFISCPTKIPAPCWQTHRRNQILSWRASTNRPPSCPARSSPTSSSHPVDAQNNRWSARRLSHPARSCSSTTQGSCETHPRDT